MSFDSLSSIIGNKIPACFYDTRKQDFDKDYFDTLRKISDDRQIRESVIFHGNSSCVVDDYLSMNGNWSLKNDELQAKGLDAEFLKERFLYFFNIFRLFGSQSFMQPDIEHWHQRTNKGKHLDWHQQCADILTSYDGSKVNYTRKIVMRDRHFAGPWNFWYILRIASSAVYDDRSYSNFKIHLRSSSQKRFYHATKDALGLMFVTPNSSLLVLNEMKSRKNICEGIDKLIDYVIEKIKPSANVKKVYSDKYARYIVDKYVTSQVIQFFNTVGCPMPLSGLWDDYFSKSKLWVQNGDWTMCFLFFCKNIFDKKPALRTLQGMEGLKREFRCRNDGWLKASDGNYNDASVGFFNHIDLYKTLLELTYGTSEIHSRIEDYDVVKKNIKENNTMSEENNESDVQVDNKKVKLSIEYDKFASTSQLFTKQKEGKTYFIAVTEMTPDNVQDLVDSVNKKYDTMQQEEE